MSGERHLERVVWAPRGGEWAPRLDAWPYSIPAVVQLIAEGGLEVPAGVTIFVGENGSGKSTLVEAIAAIYPRPGVVGGGADVVGPGASEEDSPLRWNLKARTAALASPAGFFLRAEMMHGYLSVIDADDSQRRAWRGERLQARSHGESFLTVLDLRFRDPGVYLLDEPEAALSFRSCLALIALLDVMAQEGSQVIVATHSPLLAALPSATLLELGDHGIREAAWDDLELVAHWRGFLDDPQRYLRHLLGT